MRLFVAVLPSPEVVEALRAATARVRSELPSARWAGPEEWHITLAFLGEVDDPTRAALAGGLARVAAEAPSLRLALAGGGRFGPRVLWTRPHGDLAALHELAAAVRGAAAGAGIPVEERPYRPHLTLARTTGDADLEPAVAALSSLTTPTWTAGELHLMRSRQLAGTPTYDTITAWPLRTTP